MVEGELVTGVAELDGAITKIEKEAAASPALIQQKLDSSNVQALLTTLDVMFSKASIATADKSKLLAMVQSHVSDEDSDLDMAAPAAAGYKSHSGGITDLLQSMKEKAEAELHDARTVE